MNKIQRKYFMERKYQSGATLVVIIITMLIVAIIGMALYSITDTSTLNQSIAQKSAKAYYLAESGIRIAYSEFRNISQLDTAARNSKFISLHKQVFPMPNDQGQFSLDMSPDWIYAQTAQSGTSINLYFSGGVRSGLTFPTGGILRRKGYTTIAFFNSAPVIGSFSVPNGTPVTFTFAAAYPYTFNAGDEGYIGYAYNSPQTVNAGGNLVLDNTGNKAAIFPPQNGTIYVEQFVTHLAPPDGDGLSSTVMSQYAYTFRNPYVIDPASPPATVTLQNIQAVPPVIPAAFPLVIRYSAANLTDVTQTTRIYLGKTLTIQSTSTYGN